MNVIPESMLASKAVFAALSFLSVIIPVKKRVKHIGYDNGERVADIYLQKKKRGC